MAMRRRRLRPGEFRQWCATLRRPQIRPDDSAELLGGVGRDVDLLLEVELFRLVQHVHAAAVGVVLPAMVGAPQATLLVATEEQRGTPVRAVLVEQPDSAARVAEGHEILAQ